MASMLPGVLPQLSGWKQRVILRTQRWKLSGGKSAFMRNTSFISARTVAEPCSHFPCHRGGISLGHSSSAGLGPSLCCLEVHPRPCPSLCLHSLQHQRCPLKARRLQWDPKHGLLVCIAAGHGALKFAEPKKQRTYREWICFRLTPSACTFTATHAYTAGYVHPCFAFLKPFSIGKYHVNVYIICWKRTRKQKQKKRSGQNRSLNAHLSFSAPMCEIGRPTSRTHGQSKASLWGVNNGRLCQRNTVSGNQVRQAMVPFLPGPPPLQAPLQAGCPAASPPGRGSLRLHSLRQPVPSP